MECTGQPSFPVSRENLWTSGTIVWPDSFQLLCNGSWCRFIVASFYGCAFDPQLAMKGVEYAVQELRRSQDPWMLLGDFDLEDPLTGALASDLAWSWDDAFQTETWLPATRSSGRRIDFGLGCGRHFPTSVKQRWTFSDHAEVCCEMDLTEPAGHRGPSFRPLVDRPVPEQ